jgi:hypothetical protein
LPCRAASTAAVPSSQPCAVGAKCQLAQRLHRTRVLEKRTDADA